jgi:hypothetical protein
MRATNVSLTRESTSPGEEERSQHKPDRRRPWGAEARPRGPGRGVFAERQLKIGRAHEHSSLIEAELRNFKMKQNISTGHVTYEAWRERDHDDLVLALCVAVFAAEYGTYSASGWITKLRR